MNFSRNWLYITPEEQEKMKSVRICLGGLGIGSYIAECALRLGFQRLTLLDRDSVEDSNLNRQNYTTTDIGQPKVEALSARLKALNSSAEISGRVEYLNESNIPDLIKNHDIIINCLDFDDGHHLTLTREGLRNGIPVIEPMNLGFAALCYYFTPESRAEQLSQLEKLSKANVSALNFYIQNAIESDGGEFAAMAQGYSEKYFQARRANQELPEPQLSIGSFKCAALVTELILNICVKKAVVEKFPTPIINF